LAGCSSGPKNPLPDLAVPPFCTDGADGGPPATFASVQEIFTANCAVPTCHDGSPIAPIVMQDLREGHAYSNVVRVTAYETCHDGGVPLTRVVPGDAGASFLYHKLVDETPCEGSQMPLSEVGPFPLPNCATDVIRRWIDSGAMP
jgi:hypothetical protein